MHITALRLTPLRAARQYRTQTASLGGAPSKVGGVASSRFVLMEVETDTGLVGYGEISDIPDETWPGLPALQALLEARLLGADPFDLEQLTRPFSLALDVRPDGTVYDILAAGVDCALQDLCGKHTGLPAYQLNGGAQRHDVRVSWVAYIRGVAELEGEIAERLSQGFTAFKLKVGLDPKLDEERVRLVRQLAGDEVHIKLDANSAWTTDEAVENLKRLTRWRPDGIETPVPYLDVAGKAEVRRRTGLPVLEHVNDVAFGIALLRGEAVDAFNVATTGAGGIWRARKVMALAEGAGIGCLLGSTVELGIGTAAQLHLAACSPALTWPSDLIGPFLYLQDVVSQPFGWRDGHLQVPSGPGLGVTLDPQRVQALADVG